MHHEFPCFHNTIISQLYMHLSAEESIQRYSTIESESGLEFFDSVGFLSIWKKSDLSPEYLEEIKNRAEETESVLVTDDYSAKHFPYLRYKLTYNIHLCCKKN